MNIPSSSYFSESDINKIAIFLDEYRLPYRVELNQIEGID